MDSNLQFERPPTLCQSTSLNLHGSCAWKCASVFQPHPLWPFLKHSKALGEVCQRKLESSSAHLSDIATFWVYELKVTGQNQNLTFLPFSSQIALCRTGERSGLVVWEPRHSFRLQDCLPRTVNFQACSSQNRHQRRNARRTLSWTAFLCKALREAKLTQALYTLVVNLLALAANQTNQLDCTWNHYLADYTSRGAAGDNTFLCLQCLQAHFLPSLRSFLKVRRKRCQHLREVDSEAIFRPSHFALI